jgi:hypothetical protein
VEGGHDSLALAYSWSSALRQVDDSERTEVVTGAATARPAG